MRQQRVYFVLAVFALAATAVGASLVAREYGAPDQARNFVAAEPTQGPSRVAHRPYPFRVLPSRLPPQLRVPFEALGDRLHRPGKERLTLSGSLSIAGGSARPARVLYEFPHLLEVVGHASSAVSFDEREAMRGARVSGHETEAIVETLFHDSAEHFFFAQVRGAATRFLGSGFRLEGSDGPLYDVYEVTEEVALGDAPARTKRYFFNSETQLLEGVRYEVEREGARVPVEVRVGGWRKVRGQQVPTAIMRLESGRNALSFNADSAALSPRVGSRGDASAGEAF